MTNLTRNTTAANVSEFAPGANGNISPIVILSGPHTGLVDPNGLALDRAGVLYVANFVGSVTEYGPRGDGDVTPIATIAGSNTGLDLPVGLAVGQVSTILSSSANPSVYGQALTFTATVVSNSGPGTPAGTVTFTDGSTNLGTASLNGSRATVTVSALSIGSHPITATYSGDSNFLSSSAGLTQRVNKAPTRLAAAPATRSTGQFTAELTRDAAPILQPPIPGQTVVFTVKTLLGTATLCSAVTAKNGTATCHGTVPLVALFDDSYTATYTGSANYLPSSATGKLS